MGIWKPMEEDVIRFHWWSRLEVLEREDTLDTVQRIGESSSQDDRQFFFFPIMVNELS